jgi:hypothetical protein
MKKLLLMLGFLSVCLPGRGDTLIDGPLGRGAWELSKEQSVVASWTVSSTFANVSIAAPLWTTVPGLSASGTAYLTSSALNFATSSADFNFPTFPLGGAVTSEYVGLFDNLTLSPGTYYLTLISPVRTTAVGWIVFSSSGAEQTGAGVTLGATYLGVPAEGPYAGQQPLPPGLREDTLFGGVGLRITGDPLGGLGEDPIITAAPEPPTYALMLGLALLGFTALHFKPNFLGF